MGQHIKSKHNIEVGMRKREDEDPPQAAKRQKSVKDLLPTKSKKDELPEIVSKLDALDGFRLHAVLKSSFIRKSLESQSHSSLKSANSV